MQEGVAYRWLFNPKDAGTPRQPGVRTLLFARVQRVQKYKKKASVIHEVELIWRKKLLDCFLVATKSR
jgi:hypothetical protein